MAPTIPHMCRVLLWDARPAFYHRPLAVTDFILYGLVQTACLGSDSEACHQFALAVGGAGQFVAEPGILPGLGGGLVGEQGDVADTAVDLLGYGALLLGGAGDLLAHGTYAGDGLADPVQRLVGLNDMGHAPIGLVLAGAHGVQGASGGLLQIVDQSVNLFGGVGGTLGQDRK